MTIEHTFNRTWACSNKYEIQVCFLFYLMILIVFFYVDVALKLKVEMFIYILH